jgi:hypothetical protein
MFYILVICNSDRDQPMGDWVIPVTIQGWSPYQQKFEDKNVNFPFKFETQANRNSKENIYQIKSKIL